MNLASTPTTRLKATMMTGRASAEAMLTPNHTAAHTTKANISNSLMAVNMAAKVHRLAGGCNVG